LPRGADRDPDRAHQPAHRALQDPQEGQPLTPRPAEDGRPAPSAARLLEAQGSGTLPTDHREARYSSLMIRRAAVLLPAIFVGSAKCRAGSHSEAAAGGKPFRTGRHRADRVRWPFRSCDCSEIRTLCRCTNGTRLRRLKNSKDAKCSTSIVWKLNGAGASSSSRPDSWPVRQTVPCSPSMVKRRYLLPWSPRKPRGLAWTSSR